jgi:hypothetical protein
MRRDHRWWLVAAIGIGLSFGWLLAAAPKAPSTSLYSDAPPAGRTGAPGEGTCTSCHGPLNDGQGTLTISGIPNPYLPGTKYSVTVSLARAGAMRWGFEATSLFTATNGMAGTFEITSNTTQLLSKASRFYVAQLNGSSADGTFAGTADGPVTWIFNWTAPAAGGGAVTFYIVGLAADNDGQDSSGDLTYTTSATYAESSTTPVAATTWGWIKSHYR